MPDPSQSSTSKTSSQSSLSLHQLSVCTAKKELKFPDLRPDTVSYCMHVIHVPFTVGFRCINICQSEYSGESLLLKWS